MNARLAPLAKPESASKLTKAPERPAGGKSAGAGEAPSPDRNTDRERIAALPPHLLAADAPILAVNVLALAILVGGLLYLGRYQDRLIESELEALQTEARIFAGAIGEAAVTRSGDESNDLSHDLARQMVRRLVETTDTRTRLFDAFGRW